MASISSLMSSSSSTSSIYGTRNVISGLASGMDTEAMIENAVSGYQMKISNLQQDRTKLEWEQQAYRDIINEMSVFSEKYTSYTSSTNLLSPSFFNSSVTTKSNGEYASKVSATGKTSSNIEVLRIAQLATAAKYTLSGAKLGVNGSDGKTIAAGSELDLTAKTKNSLTDGTLSFKEGDNRSFSIKMDDTVFEDKDAFVAAINAKLDEIREDNNHSVRAELVDGSIQFTAGNKLTVSASGKIADTLSITEDSATQSTAVVGALIEEKSNAELLSGTEISFTLDGVTKKVTLGEYTESTDSSQVLADLQDGLKDAFGDKVTVSMSDGKLSFSIADGIEGSALAISGGKALGLDSDGETSYVNTSNTLGKLLGDDAWSGFDKTKAASAGELKEGTDYYVDSEGNRVKQADDNEWYRVDDNGEYLYDFKINGEVVGSYNKDTALSTVMNDINGNSEAGVKVNYSQLTNTFTFTARETGADSGIEMDGLAGALFGDDNGTVGAGTTGYDAGQNAKFTVSVDDKEMSLERSSNTVSLDGLNVTLKGEFGYDTDGNVIADTEAVSFTTTADADKIVEAVKAFVEGYNKMANSIKDAYSTMPQTNSSGDYYEPLTDADKEDMSESAIKSYEEKAKQGLLFGDRDLSNLYSELRSAISLTGQAGADMNAIGITISYSEGKTTLSLDESKLRSALESDPDKVADVFTDSENGLAQRLRDPLDKYAKTTGTKGVLVQKAGSELAPTSLYQNQLQSKLEDLDDQITRWQEKLSDKVDYYTNQFTLLEQLISEMNSQSSALSGLMGGY